MKRLSILFVAVATLAFSSCSLLGGAGNTSAATATGQTCGAAILSLYQAYQTSGTVDLTNANNLANALALASCYSQIKQNKDNNEYRSAFGNGLILSSAGLITSENSNAFINALLSASSLATMANATNNTSSSSSSSTSTTTPNLNNITVTPDINRLMNTLDKK